jgi:hypothetical protein
MMSSSFKLWKWGMGRSIAIGHCLVVCLTVCLAVYLGGCVAPDPNNPFSKARQENPEASKSQAEMQHNETQPAKTHPAETHPAETHQAAAQAVAKLPTPAPTEPSTPVALQSTEAAPKNEPAKKLSPAEAAQEQQRLAEQRSVNAATTQWLATVTSGRPNAAPEVTKLYAPDAILVGTVSEQVRDTPLEIRDYFNYFTQLPRLSVSGYRPFIRVYGAMAINSGYYTFSYEKEGHTNVVPARYTFVYRKVKGDWIITEHHSSALPKAPEQLKPAVD